MNKRLGVPSGFVKSFMGDHVGVVKDEIALEGLDGITLQALWERLKRVARYDFIPDTESKQFIWKSVKGIKDFEFYLLPERRDDLEVFVRSEYMDTNNTFYEPVTLKEDIYKYKPIDIEGNDEKYSRPCRGSCPTFDTRKNVTNYIRKNDLELDYVNKRFGNGLVIVASQELREKALFGETTPSDLTTLQYCIMERIGRSRYEGEPTKGQIGLSIMNIDPKSLFYQRKFLVSRNYVTRQTIVLKFGVNRKSMSLTLFHLPRFYTFIESGFSKSLRQILQAIHQSPLCRIENSILKAKFGKSFVNNLAKPEYSNYFQVQSVVSSELDVERACIPESLEVRTTKKSSRKKLQVLCLKQPHLGIEETVQEMCAEDESDPLEEDELGSITINAINQSQNTSYMRVVQELIKSRAKGLSILDIKELLPSTYLEARTITRYLLRQKLVSSISYDSNKTRVHRFILNMFKEAAYTQMKTEVPDDQSSEEQPVDISTVESANIISVENLSEVPGIEYVAEVPQISIIEAPKSEHPLNENVGPPKAKKLRFTQTEDAEFDTLSNQSLEYEIRGWKVLITYSDVKQEYSRGCIETPKSMKRENYILHKIKRNKFIIGFQQLIQGLRAFEGAENVGNQPNLRADRKSIYRLLKKLKNGEKIELWKINISKMDAHRICSVFTEHGIDPSSPILNLAANTLIDSMYKKKGGEKGPKKSTAFLKPPAKRKAPKRDKSEVKPKREKKIKNDITTHAKNILSQPKTRLPKQKPISPRFQTTSIFKNRWVDNIDKEAISRKKSERVDWTVDEDRIILTATICSLIFIPKYRLNRLFVFNATQIRDLLHETLPLSNSKTSIAVRRRIHFIKKKSLYSERYQFLLDDILTDPFVNKISWKTKVVTRIDKTYGEIPMDALRKVFRYFYAKHYGKKVFKKHLEKQEAEKVELEKEKFVKKLPRIRDYIVENKDVPKNLGVKRQKIIENATLEPKDISELNRWAARSAILSVTFSRNPHTSTFPFLDNISGEILHSVTSSMRALGIAILLKTLPRFSLSLVMKRKLISHFKPSMFRKGHNILALFSSGQSAAEIDLHFLSCVTILAEMSISNSINYSLNIPGNMFTLNEDWREKNIGEEEFDPLENFDVATDEEIDPELKAKFKNARIAMMSVSNKALHLLRTKLNTKMNTLFLKTDLFNANMPEIQATPFHANADELHPYRYMNLQEDLLGVLEERLFVSIPEQQDLLQNVPKKYLSLYKLIEKTEENGISFLYLKAKFEEGYLREGIDLLVRTKNIYLVGVEFRKFVSFPFIKSWALPVPMQGDTSKLTNVVMHSWITCAGTLNRGLIDRLLTALIGIISDGPITHIETICDSIKPILSNVECYTLLQILNEYDIIRFLRFNSQREKNTLFAQGIGFYKYDLDPLFEIEDATVELLPNFTTKYSYLQEIINPLGQLGDNEDEDGMEDAPKKD